MSFSYNGERHILTKVLDFGKVSYKKNKTMAKRAAKIFWNGVTDLAKIRAVARLAVAAAPALASVGAAVAVTCTGNIKNVYAEQKNIVKYSPHGSRPV